MYVEKQIQRYARARYHVAAALRSGRTSLGAVTRFVAKRDPELDEWEVFAAVLAMGKAGELDILRDMKLTGTTDFTRKWKHLNER